MKKIIIFLLVFAFINFISACGSGILTGVNKLIEVGDTIQLGKIDWIVLTIDDGKALLLSDKIIETKAFDSISNDWENSEIRKYLNGAFYDTKFNNQEKKKIAETRLTTENQNRTDDKIFLLSVEEVNEYMGDNAHLNMRNAKIAENIETKDTWWWWLRSPGFENYETAYVEEDGNIYGHIGDLSGRN